MITYAICLVFGLMFSLVSIFAGHLFGGHESIGTGGHADAGFDADGVPGITFFSPTVLASFITAFGGFGLVFSDIPLTAHVWISAPLAFLMAFLIASGVLWLFNAVFRRTQSSSEGRVGQLIGHPAAIITPIPVGGVGEISYVQSGSRYSAAARTTDQQAISAGTTVKITRIIGNQFFVEAVPN
jgi:membrane protein implicated in regulation of membrane protease activity